MVAFCGCPSDVARVVVFIWSVNCKLAQVWLCCCLCMSIAYKQKSARALNWWKRLLSPLQFGRFHLLPWVCPRPCRHPALALSLALAPRGSAYRPSSAPIALDLLYPRCFNFLVKGGKCQRSLSLSLQHPSFVPFAERHWSLWEAAARAHS